MAKATLKDRIAAELAAIQSRAKDHILHAERVVAWARSHPSSALHSQFEWSDSKAAHEFRIWQARRIIAITINQTDQPPNIVSLTFDRVQGGGYRAVADVLQNRKLSLIMLQDALADLERVRQRYEHVKELTSVWSALDKLKAKTKRGSEARATA